MNIVHYNLTTTTKEGGVETFVWELAAQQAALGHNVTVIGGTGLVRRRSSGVHVWTVPFIDRAHFAVGPLKRAYALRKLWERVSMVPMAWPLLLEAELVHIHKPYDLILGPWLKQRGIPLIYHGHGEDFFRGDRQLMKTAAALISCSAYNAQSLQQRYGRTASIVYNGVDTAHFIPRQSSELRQQLARGADTLLMMPGRMMPWKGHHDVLEALTLLPERSLQLSIVGDGEMRQQLETFVSEHNLTDRVSFTGTIAHREIANYLAAADIVIGASYASETFGMVLAETLACQRPVLASSWRGYDDVVLDQHTGHRFQARDPQNLAATLTTMLDNPEHTQKLANQGRQRVLELFAWQRIAERVQNVYDHVLAQPSYIG